MAMPSSTAIVLNSFATPPAAWICSATILPRSRRCTWPGTNSVNELAIAMIGLPKSPSVMPVARQSARAPAMLRPEVEVAERSCGIPSGYAAVSPLGGGLQRCETLVEVLRDRLVEEELAQDGERDVPLAAHRPVDLRTAAGLGKRERGHVGGLERLEELQRDVDPVRSRRGDRHGPRASLAVALPGVVGSDAGRRAAVGALEFRVEPFPRRPLRPLVEVVDQSMDRGRRGIDHSRTRVGEVRHTKTLVAYGTMAPCPRPVPSPSRPSRSATCCPMTAPCCARGRMTPTA